MRTKWNSTIKKYNNREVKSHWNSSTGHLRWQKKEAVNFKTDQLKLFTGATKRKKNEEK